MPPKVDWNQKDALRLMNLYCLYDHLPPRHVPDGIPKTIEQLGDELTKLYEIQIDRRSLQYQLPLRRYQLWKQFDPESCPPPEMKLKRGMLRASPFFRNPNAVRMVIESDLKNKSQCSTNSELSGPPSVESPTVSEISSPVPIEANVNLPYNDDQLDGSGIRTVDSFTDNEAPESLNSLGETTNNASIIASGGSACKATDKKELGAIQKKEGSCGKSKKKQTSENPFTWVLNSRCSLSWIAVRSGPSVKLFKPNKSVGNRNYFVCIGCRSTAYFDNDSDQVIESHHYGTCEVINTIDFDQEQTKRRLKLKRPQKDSKSGPTDDTESQKSPLIDCSSQVHDVRFSEEQEVPKLDVSSNDCNINEPILPEREISTGRVQFTRALNSRLQPNLIATSHNDGIKLFTINKHKDSKAYVKCTGCGTSGSFFLDEEYLQYKSHSGKCKTITREDYIDEQAHRNSRLLALKGEQPQKAYRRAFAAARKIGFGNTFRPYCFSKSQIARWAKKGATEYPETLINGERWLLGKTESAEVYCTDNAARELANCRILVVDGTFETAPKGFFQVLTFHGLSQNVEGQEEFNPLCFALMRDKKEASYAEVVKMIMDRMESLNVECKVERIHADYEQGLRNALKPLVPENGVRGCLFHFSQAVLKRVGKGLYKFYNMQFGKKYRPEFMRIRVWIRTLLALPCLPHKDMLWLWETLRHPPKPPHSVPDWPYDLLEELSEYMNEWFTTADLSCTFFGLGRVRNTNVAEGYHSAQKHIYSRKPRVATFLQQRCIDAEMAEVRFRQLKIPGTVVKPCDKLYVTLREKVKQLEDDYVAGLKYCISDISRQLYMIRFARRSSHLLHDTVNKSGTTRKNAKRKALLDVHNDSLQWRQCLGVDEDLYSSIVNQEEAMEEEGYVSDGELNPTLADRGQKDYSDVDDSDEHSDVGMSVADDSDVFMSDATLSDTDSDVVTSVAGDFDVCLSDGDLNETAPVTGDSNLCLSDADDVALAEADSDDVSLAEADSDDVALAEADSDDVPLAEADSDDVALAEADADVALAEADADVALAEADSDDVALAEADSDVLCLTDADAASLSTTSRGVLKPLNANNNRSKRTKANLPPKFDIDDSDENGVICIGKPKRVQECRLPSASILKEKAKKTGLKFLKSIYTAQTLEIYDKTPKILHNVFADGNCGYRALSYAMTGTEANHEKIRKDVSAKLIDSQFVGRFESAFGEDIYEYAEQHRMPATVAWDQSKWMTSRDMFAACLVYNIDIFVYTGKAWSQYTENFMRREDKVEYANPAILLYNPHNIHYQVVLAVD